ncbi:MAG TPA: hypothetical protein VFG64_04715 [Dongiaceae bacterium]|nr:hypothetical protein [Dongiaceae bacterium]
MSEIELDPRKLLGFRIVATGEAQATLRSAKIGSKGCTFVVEESQGGSGSAIAARIGDRLSNT